VSLANALKTRILAIDNSTNSTAWSLWEGSKLIDYGEITFPGKYTFDRIPVMVEALAGLRDIAQTVKAIYIEKTAMINSRQTVILLAMSAGAALASIANSGVKIIEVPALSWQSYIGVKITAQDKQKIRKDNPGKVNSWYKTAERKLRKQKIMDFVGKQYGIHVETDNLSDALSIGHFVVNKGYNV
jgi:hypothetical protein